MAMFRSCTDLDSHDQRSAFVDQVSRETCAATYFRPIYGSAEERSLAGRHKLLISQSSVPSPVGSPGRLLRNNFGPLMQCFMWNCARVRPAFLPWATSDADALVQHLHRTRSDFQSEMARVYATMHVSREPRSRPLPAPPQAAPAGPSRAGAPREAAGFRPARRLREGYRQQPLLHRTELPLGIDPNSSSLRGSTGNMTTAVVHKHSRRTARGESGSSPPLGRRSPSDFPHGSTGFHVKH